ncbi:MAG: hypothetical protein CVU57_21655 [Deltaproteobacteria bacterium HGW-Deltaproteobacteria-15]|nr:MAG: hypothetical protein CVU57_21655 [Deltaproteobacteria bacterium HGW-Deltaproteobacteria-15]
MSKRLAWIIVLLCSAGLVFTSCAGTQNKATADSFKSPVVKLASFEVPQYDGFWYYAKAVAPTKGAGDDRGAPLPMSFLFEIQNPNPFPVMLEGVTYTVAFDNDFELITTNNNDSYWIPAGKTDQVRLTTMITVRSALTALLLANAPLLKNKGWEAFPTLERWWKDVPMGTTSVSVKNASFTFVADGVTKVVPVQAKFP